MELFKKSIKNRVMDIVSQRIEQAQARHDENTKILKAQLEADIEKSAEVEATSILNKF